MEQRKAGIIGLTGTYCAGKNYVARLLEERGMAVLDVDKLGHQAITLEREAILKRFGPDVLGDGGEIDRSRLGAAVFGSSEALSDLEGIVHPVANRLTEEWIERQRDRPRVINAALLHRSSAFDRLEAIILVRSPVIIRLVRARRRDGLPWLQLVKRFRSQKNFMAQYFRQNTDIYTVDNGFCLAGVFSKTSRERWLREQLDRLLSKLG